MKYNTTSNRRLTALHFTVLRLTILLLSILFLSLIASCSEKTATGSVVSSPSIGPEIKIGVILPLSGDLGVLGLELQRGIELAVEEWNEKNKQNGSGINGPAITVIFEDDKGLQAVPAVNAANKLTAFDHVDLGITGLVEEAEPILPIFRDNHTPLLVLWDSNRLIQEGGEFIFSNGFSTEAAGETMADYAYSTLHLRRIAVLRHIDSWAGIITSSFKQRFEGLGGTIVYSEALQPDEKDFRTPLLKIQQSNPDGVYAPLIPPLSTQFFLQAKELHLGIPILTGDALIQDVIDGSQGGAEGTYFTNIYADRPEDLTAKYRSRFGTDPVDISVFSFGYEGIKKIEPAFLAYPQHTFQYSLSAIFGPLRSAQKKEQLFKVKEGKALLIP